MRDRLIVMDDVSGLTDESKKFAAFLTVNRKYIYNCVYIFHTIFPEKANWRLILSQTNSFNIFPASVPINSVRKILEGACSRKSKKYIPQNAFWLNRLFFDLANTNDNPEFQVCCLIQKTTNSFITSLSAKE